MASCRALRAEGFDKINDQAVEAEGSVFCEARSLSPFAMIFLPEYADLEAQNRKQGVTTQNPEQIKAMKSTNPSSNATIDSNQESDNCNYYGNFVSSTISSATWNGKQRLRDFSGQGQLSIHGYSSQAQLQTDESIQTNVTEVEDKGCQELEC
jgi:hypothetical protein